jgi:hypothetical protein
MSSTDLHQFQLIALTLMRNCLLAGWVSAKKWKQSAVWVTKETSNRKRENCLIYVISLSVALLFLKHNCHIYWRILLNKLKNPLQDAFLIITLQDAFLIIKSLSLLAELHEIRLIKNKSTQKGMLSVAMKRQCLMQSMAIGLVTWLKE